MEKLEISLSLSMLKRDCSNMLEYKHDRLLKFYNQALYKWKCL